jgi:hypothetical protein
MSRVSAVTHEASDSSRNYGSILKSARQEETRTRSADRATLILLSPKMRRELVDELYNALQIAQSGNALDEIHDIIGDWIATAQVWSNEELRNEVIEVDANPPAEVLI